MSASNYGSTVLSDWCDVCAPNWAAYTDHAFVRGLGDGSLPRKAFLHYLVQDYVFLVHFSRAWSLAVVKAETMDEMRYASAMVNALVNEEMQLHVQTCQAEGLSEQQLYEATEEDETLAYTRYVLDAGLGGDFLDMLAALSPCVFGYGQIGAALAARSARGNPYQDWIDTYAGDDYQQVCESAATLLEQSVGNRLGPNARQLPRWDVLTKRFDTATRLEVAFWEMGLRAGQ